MCKDSAGGKLLEGSCLGPERGRGERRLAERDSEGQEGERRGGTR